MTWTHWTEPSAQRGRWRRWSDLCRRLGLSGGPGVRKTWLIFLSHLIPSLVAKIFTLFGTSFLFFRESRTFLWLELRNELYILLVLVRVLPVKHIMSAGSEDQQSIPPPEPQPQILLDTHSSDRARPVCCWTNWGTGSLFWLTGCPRKWAGSRGLFESTTYPI